MASWARPGGDDISRCASWHHVQTQPHFMKPQDAAPAIGVQGSKGCQLSPVSRLESPVLSHPVSETLIHVARFQALVCTPWEDFFLLGGASAPILGYKCLCLLGGTFCEWPAHFCKKALETLRLTHVTLPPQT